MFIQLGHYLGDTKHYKLPQNTTKHYKTPQNTPQNTINHHKPQQATTKHIQTTFKQSSGSIIRPRRTYTAIPENINFC